MTQGAVFACCRPGTGAHVVERDWRVAQSADYLPTGLVGGKELLPPVPGLVTPELPGVPVPAPLEVPLLPLLPLPLLPLPLLLPLLPMPPVLPPLLLPLLSGITLPEGPAPLP